MSTAARACRCCVFKMEYTNHISIPNKKKHEYIFTIVLYLQITSSVTAIAVVCTSAFVALLEFVVGKLYCAL